LFRDAIVEEIENAPDNRFIQLAQLPPRRIRVLDGRNRSPGINKQDQ
jgi:hypothetical protein